MPDTTEQDEAREGQPPEQASVRRRMAWFFGIAAVSGLAFAAAAELLRWLLLH
jgi:hypothetical protein